MVFMRRRLWTRTKPSITLRSCKTLEQQNPAFFYWRCAIVWTIQEKGSKLLIQHPQSWCHHKASKKKHNPRRRTRTERGRKITRNRNKESSNPEIARRTSREWERGWMDIPAGCKESVLRALEAISKRVAAVRMLTRLSCKTDSSDSTCSFTCRNWSTFSFAISSTTLSWSAILFLSLSLSVSRARPRCLSRCTPIFPLLARGCTLGFERVRVFI